MEASCSNPPQERGVLGGRRCQNDGEAGTWQIPVGGGRNSPVSLASNEDRNQFVGGQAEGLTPESSRISATRRGTSGNDGYPDATNNERLRREGGEQRRTIPEVNNRQSATQPNRNGNSAMQINAGSQRGRQTPFSTPREGGNFPPEGYQQGESSQDQIRQAANLPNRVEPN